MDSEYIKYNLLPKIISPSSLPLYNLSESYTIACELPQRYMREGTYTVTISPFDNEPEDGHPSFFRQSSTTMYINAGGENDDIESMGVEILVRDDCCIQNIPEFVKYRYFEGTYTETSIEERSSGSFPLYIFRFAEPIFSHFSPDHSPVNILLAGLTGSTKSSFGNSVVTAIDQQPTDLKAPFLSGGGDSHVTVKLGRKTIRHTCINIWDMWGYSPKATIKYEVLWHIINGNLPSGWEMNKDPDEIILSQHKNSAHQRRIHAIVFFVPQAALSDPNLDRDLSATVEIWRTIREHTREFGARGLPMFLLISKVDEVMPHARANPESTQNDIASLKLKAYERFDATEHQVHFNINYTEETKKIHVIDRLNLSLFLNYLQAAERYKSEI